MIITITTTPEKNSSSVKASGLLHVQHKVIDTLNRDLLAGGNGVIAVGLPIGAIHENGSFRIDFGTRDSGCANELRQACHDTALERPAGEDAQENGDKP